MRVIGHLLMWVSLVAGVLGAITAYHAGLDLPDEQLVGLTLAADAGGQLDEEGQLHPAIAAGTLLTETDVDRLRENTVETDGGSVEVTRVRVKQFSFQRWQGKWLFLGAVVGMMAGALAVRRDTRQRLPRTSDGHHAEKIAEFLRESIDQLDKLPHDLQLETSPGREVTHRLQRAIGGLQEGFPRAIDDIRANYPLGTAAGILERLAVAERSLNRARSTATDGDIAEALTCLEAAVSSLRETVARLEATT